jgi:GNAT superfamily N-acetyltransferase
MDSYIPIVAHYDAGLKRDGSIPFVMHLKEERFMEVSISTKDSILENEVLDIYKANGWSSADKPKELLAALTDSHTLVTARIAGKLVGLGNAISDGHLVVYYPHMLVHPDYQGNGIGRKMMEAMQTIYSGFHQQMLTADGEAVKFYQSVGFERAGKTESMWIYSGKEH